MARMYWILSFIAAVIAVVAIDNDMNTYAVIAAVCSLGSLALAIYISERG